ncbi:MAG: hypothetical protein LPK45_00490 [Bacteroidota bacterium]|nr:hypothetical protein [Bacteroidota bacterium]MDX5429504.1 hypothetical protein [Bacteroidota bacterium]MDX5468289.1 hypothetical protein [Bacteroidota bacterium]
MHKEYEKLELYRNRDIGQMMGFAATLVRRHYKHMFRTIGLMSLPLVLAASTLYFLGTSRQLEVFSMIRSNPQVLQEQGLYNLNLILSYLASYFAFLSIVWGGVYYVQLYDEKGPENFQWNDIWNKVFEHGWKAIFGNIIIFFIIFTLMFLAILPAFTIILIPVTFILILGLSALTFLWEVVYLFEKKNALESLDISFKLLKKQWWKAIGLLIISYAIVYGFIAIPTLGILIPNFIRSATGAMNPINEDTIFWILIFQNINTVVGFIASFFMVLSFTAFYLTNKERLFHVSLGRRIDQLELESETGTYS